MIKSKIFPLYIIILILLILPENILAQNPSKIIVALNEKPSFPNRGMKGTENLKNPGVAFETLKMIEKQIGIPFNFVRLPYKRCLYDLENGKVDAVMTGSYKEEREKHGVYPMKNGKPDLSRKVYDSAYYLYVLNDSKVMWDGKKFYNLSGTVGAELGFSIIEDLQKSGIIVRTAPNAEANFELLLNRRLAGVVAHETTGQRFIYKYPKIKQLEPSLDSKPYFLLISHQFYTLYPELSEKIWNAISRLREETSEWRELKKKYFLMQEWPEGGMKKIE